MLRATQTASRVGEYQGATVSQGRGQKSARKGRGREVKAAIPSDLAELVQTAATEHVMSVMAYVRAVSLAGLDNERVIRAMSPFYRRGYCTGNRAYFGTGGDIDALIPEGDDVVRVATRYTPDEFEKIAYLAYALGCSVSQAQSILLAESVRLRVTVDG